MESPTELAQAIDRVLELGERDGQPTKAVRVKRTFATSVDDLWDAVTDPDRLARWFLPVSGDLKVGGSYQLQGNAGGEILACDAPRRLSVTWVMGDNTSWVNIDFRATDDGASELELVHTAHVPEEFWNQYGPGATGVGWDLALTGIAFHLADVPNPGEEWTLQPDGREFAQASSRAWADASIAAGTPEHDARAAGGRTTAFYTGEPSTA
jgi:uncharacterized protein YndB with AHSA1/START domain